MIVQPHHPPSLSQSVSLRHRLLHIHHTEVQPQQPDIMVQFSTRVKPLFKSIQIMAARQKSIIIGLLSDISILWQAIYPRKMSHAQIETVLQRCNLHRNEYNMDYLFPLLETQEARKQYMTKHWKIQSGVLKYIDPQKLHRCHAPTAKLSH